MLLLNSCVSLNESISADDIWNKDLIIGTQWGQFEGVASLPDVDRYEFEFESKGNIDLFTLKSCHQYQTIEPDRIIKRKQIKVTYRPNSFERSRRICPLFIHAYEKGKGRHSFGIVDFKRKIYSAKATIECNGGTYDAIGSAICQSGANLYQRITFAEESRFKSDCQDVIEKEGLSYKIKIKKDLCLTTFIVGKEFFRLTTYGFEKVLIY